MAGHEPPISQAARILIVEDDRDIADSLDAFLRRDGYQTERAHDGRRAIASFHAVRPDLVLLDLGLPVVDGVEVLRAIRTTSDAPVIVVTARADEVDELVGFGLGADDYVTKPFSSRALLARVRAVLRRSRRIAAATDVTRLGALVVDRDRLEACVDDALVPLTATEFGLLAALAETPGRVLSRDALIERAMPESDALERTVDGHLHHLRRKLAEHGVDRLLETVRGVGYRLRPPRP